MLLSHTGRRAQKGLLYHEGSLRLGVPWVFHSLSSFFGWHNESQFHGTKLQKDCAQIISRYSRFAEMRTSIFKSLLVLLFVFLNFKITSHEIHQKGACPSQKSPSDQVRMQRMCLSSGFTAVMNTMAKSKVQRKGLFGLWFHCSTLKSGQKFKQESRAGAEAMEGYCLQVCSPWLSQPAFL